MSTGTPKSGPRLVTRSLAYLPKMVARPRKTARELLAEKTIHPSLIVVLGFALLESLLFLISYLAGDYPPPAGELRTWIEAWGEFAMLPFIKVPAENYRLAQAIFMVPLMLAIWMLMACSARLLSIIFGTGRVSFDQYLNFFGFSFFAFMIVAAALDFTFSSVFGNFVSALRGEHGRHVPARDVHGALRARRPLQRHRGARGRGVFDPEDGHRRHRYLLVADGVDLVAAEVIIHEAVPLDPAETILAPRLLPSGVRHRVGLLGSGSPMSEEIG